MIYQLTVPAVADDVEEFRVLEWHGELGHVFESGDLVVELETHKAIVEVRAAQVGVFRKNLTAAGSWCRIKVPLGIFSDSVDEVVPEDAHLAGELLVKFEIC